MSTEVDPSAMGQLGIVGELAVKMLGVQSEIDRLEEELAAKKRAFRELNEVTIPEKMMEMGITEVTLDDDTKLTMRQYYSAKISPEREEEAFAWLTANGHDGIIKSKVNCSFGRGDEETRKEEQLVRMLDNAEIPYDRKRGVHHSTLKAFVREQIESGQNFPQTLFGVYIGNQIKIRR